MNHALQGKQVKTGDKFGIIGYWVNKDQSHPDPLSFIEDPNLIVGGITRVVYVYFGLSKPSQQEIKALIKNSPPFP